jgi:hypothetical protein
VARRYEALGGDVVSWALAAPLSLGRVAAVTRQLTPARGGAAARIRATASLDVHGAPLQLPAPIAGDSAALVLLALALRALAPDQTSPAIRGVLTGSGSVQEDGVGPVSGWPEKLTALAGALTSTATAGEVTLLCPRVQQREVEALLKGHPAFTPSDGGWQCGDARVLLVPIAAPTDLLHARPAARSRAVLIAGASVPLFMLLAAALLSDSPAPRSTMTPLRLWTGEQTGAALHRVYPVVGVLEDDEAALALFRPAARSGRGRLDLHAASDPAAPIVSLTSAWGGSLIHASALSVPDVDRDGYPELVVAIPESDRAGRNAGEVLLLPGGPALQGGALAAQATARWTGDAAIARLGAVIAPLDGLIAAGAPGQDSIFLLDPIDSMARVSAIRGRGDQGIGRSMASGDILGGDGIADLVVGAPLTDSHHGAETGVVLLYQGPIVDDLDARSPIDFDSDVSKEHYGLFPGSRAGDRVWVLGDVDGDGLDDFAALTPGPNRWGSVEGAIHVYLGRPVVQDPWANGDWGYQAILGEAGQSLLEASVQAADLDGDGAQDIVVGFRRGEIASAAVWYGPLHTGTMLPTDADLVEPFGVEHAMSHLTAVDLDQDGDDEVLLGTPSWGQDQLREAGAVWVLGEGF